MDSFNASWRSLPDGEWSDIHWFQAVPNGEWSAPVCGAEEPEGDYETTVPGEPILTCPQCMNLNLTRDHVLEALQP